MATKKKRIAKTANSISTLGNGTHATNAQYKKERTNGQVKRGKKVMEKSKELTIKQYKAYCDTISAKCTKVEAENRRMKAKFNKIDKYVQQINSRIWHISGLLE